MKKPMLQGQDSAMRHLKEVDSYVSSLSDADRIQWFTGFIAAAVGRAYASIGPGHASAILDDIKAAEPQALAELMSS